ncbi:MAG: HEAT repeat domain-containing protein [Verrucomicrobiae bacterium]|nr:HEAT repeat domain-containing protein [Verrucomicrobiae bacterium]
MPCFTDQRSKLPFVGLCLLLALAGSSFLHAQDELASPTVLSRVSSGDTLSWTTDVEKALAVAGTEYQPVIVVFSMPDCPWCKRLDREVLQDSLIQERLQPFVRVKVDILEDRSTAQRYGVRSVPAIRILSSDGRISVSFDGYVPAGKMEATLAGLINAEYLRASDAEFVALLQALESGTVTAEQWPEIMLSLGDTKKRKTLEEAISALEVFPRAAFVEMLNDPRLSVRLGALELLEERSTDTDGFDPWAPKSTESQDALAKLAIWSTQPVDSTATERIASLTDQQLESYIRDLISKDSDRAQRALRLLESAGASVANGLTRYINDETLPEGSRNKVREAQYLLAMPPLDGVEPATLANRLVFGNLDQRLKAISTLQKSGRDAAPILKDFLKEEDSMIREAAVDGLAESGDLRVAKLFSTFLENEKDENVIHSVLRGLGKIPSKTGLTILVSYVKHEKEDLAIAALNSIAKLRSSRAKSEVLAALKDDRWRVRSVALETITALRSRDIDSQIVAPLLSDPDQFVRFNAVNAVRELELGGLNEQLNKLFDEDPTMMAPVIGTYVETGMPLPASFVERVTQADPDIILQCIEEIGYRAEYGDLLRSLSGHNDLDVACAALRSLARETTDSASLSALVSALAEDRPEKNRAILGSLTFDENAIKRAHRTFGEPKRPTIQSAAASGRSSPALAVVDAFLNPNRGSDGVKAVDVIASFLAVGNARSSDSPAGAEDAPSLADDPFSTLLVKVQKIMRTSQRPDEQLLAGRILATAGNSEACDFILKRFDSIESEWRDELAEKLSNSPFESISPLLERLLDDPSEAVRNSAVYSAFAIAAEDKPHFASVVLNALSEDGSRLAPQDVLVYRFGSALRSRKVMKVVRDWTITTLAREDLSRELQVLGLVVLEIVWKAGDDVLVQSSIESNDAYIRRAACHALGRGDQAKFLTMVAQIASDESELVRQVVPSVFVHAESQDKNWKNVLGEGIVASDIYNDARSTSYSMRSRQRKSDLPEEALAAIKELTKDTSAKVRVDAFFTLLSYQEPIDLNQFVATINEFPDRKGIANRVEDYLGENFAELGKEFAALLPIAEQSSYGVSDLEKMRVHFGIDEEDGDAELTFRERPSLDGPVEATFVKTEPQTEEVIEALRERPIEVVYFHKTGCSECARVTDILSTMQEVFPKLQIQKYNIEESQSKLLNETLSERFNVPERIRLVSPALFASSGYLIKDDISSVAVERLLIRSAEEEPAGADEKESQKILEVTKADIAQAAKAVEQRYDAMTLGVVSLAGLLDGINPCAFATIIFFLSYLQVARRSPREILAVGSAFIAAVFLTYFALGLGLAKLLAGLTALEWASNALTWVFAGITLVIMVLSVRDGILCLQGKMQSMSLQLPGFLKNRIRKTIRENSKNSHFVVAAFVSGVVISVLELACTGQVYLPTIKIMLQQGKMSAIGYLTLYNSAFVAPLIAIFILSYFGMKSDTLVRFQQKNTALVKFAMALLFLALFLFLIWGQVFAS